MKKMILNVVTRNKFALAIVFFAAMSAFASCCPPVCGDDPWGGDPGNGEDTLIYVNH